MVGGRLNKYAVEPGEMGTIGGTKLQRGYWLLATAFWLVEDRCARHVSVIVT